MHQVSQQWKGSLWTRSRKRYKSNIDFHKIIEGLSNNCKVTNAQITLCVISKFNSKPEKSRMISTIKPQSPSAVSEEDR